MKDIQRAERGYSAERLQSLQDEWFVDYPYASEAAKALFKEVPARTQVSRLLEPAKVTTLANLLLDPKYAALPVATAAVQVCNGHEGAEQFVNALLACFFRIGLVGLKLEPTAPVAWFDDSGQPLAAEALHANVSVEVHPMFRLSVGCTEVAG